MPSTEKPPLYFIGVGAARSGTTWLAQCLDEHPELCLSRPKEVNFFNETYPLHHASYKSRYEKGFSWYAKRFSHCKKNAKCGEFSPIYFADPTAAQRIYDAYPDCKIIISLRNPIDKLLSYLSLKRSQTTNLTGTTADEIITHHPEFIQTSLYVEKVKKYQEIFGNKNVHIILHDDIRNQPQKVLHDLFIFLKVAPDATIPTLHKTIHAVKSKQGYIRAAAMKGLKIFRKIPGSYSLIDWLKYSGILFAIEKYVDRIDIQNPRKKPLTLRGGERKKWHDAYFAEDILALEALLSRDLSAWKER